MRFTVEPLTSEHADDVAAWHYEPPYDFYDATADPVDLAELLDPARRHRFRAALDEASELVGFYYFVQRDAEVEIGLGLRPDITGQGLGRSFLEAGLEHARSSWAPARFRLFVATFNERAIRLYEHAGFRRVATQTRAFPFGELEFLEMEQDVE